MENLPATFFIGTSAHPSDTVGCPRLVVFDQRPTAGTITLSGTKAAMVVSTNAGIDAGRQGKLRFYP